MNSNFKPCLCHTKWSELSKISHSTKWKTNYIW